MLYSAKTNPFCPRTEELEYICHEAATRYKNYVRSGVRGQAFVEQDSFDYWVWIVSKEVYRNPNTLFEQHNYCKNK